MLIHIAKLTHKSDLKTHENITIQVRLFPYNLVLLQLN